MSVSRHGQFKQPLEVFSGFFIGHLRSPVG